MSEKKESAASVLIGAAFLMATSAIGPGFLTQTTVFTDQLKAAFAFAIVVSIIIDIIVQLNIWRILGVSGKRAQDVANEVFPGLGYFIAILVAIGGLIFNIGNVGGAAMGLNVICGLPLAPAAIISALCAIVLFISKEAGKAMDMFTKVLGIIMLAMVGFMVVKTQPPVGLALKETVIPSQIDWLTIRRSSAERSADTSPSPARTESSTRTSPASTTSAKFRTVPSLRSASPASCATCSSSQFSASSSAERSSIPATRQHRRSVSAQASSVTGSSA